MLPTFTSLLLSATCFNVIRPVSLATMAVINSARKVLLERAKLKASGNTPQQTREVDPVSNAHNLTMVNSISYFVAA